MTVPTNKQFSNGVTPVTGDEFNTFLQTVRSASDLRQFVGKANMQVNLLGIAGPGLGYAGSFWWNENSTAADDNLNVIVPPAASSGAWIRTAIALGPTGPSGATGATGPAAPTRGALLSCDANTIPSNAPATIVWSAAAYDTDGFWSAGDPTKLTIPSGVSKVRLSTSVTWNSGPGTGYRMVFIGKNASGIPFGGSQAIADALATQPDQTQEVLTAEIQVSDGDFFEVYCIQYSGGGDFDVGGIDTTWFQIEVVESLTGATGPTGPSGGPTGPTGPTGSIGATGATGGGSEAVNAQTGTSYAFAASDRGKLVTFSNSSAVAATIAQAGTATFPADWWCDFQNQGVGLVTITPTTSTISGTTAFRAMTGFGGRIVSNGTNYLVQNSAALYSLASSAISNWLPGIPSSTLGGNSRGSTALDIQTARNNAAQVASGVASIALGKNSTSSGTASVAIGSTAGATSDGAVAIGNLANATGNNAISLGVGTASGGRAVAFPGCTATQDGAFAAGYSALSSATYAFSFGPNTSAGGSTSFAFGSAVLTTGTYGFATGYQGDDRGNYGAWVRNGGGITGADVFHYGRTQIETHSLVNSTSGSSAVRLTANNAAAGASNVAALGTHQSVLVTVEIIITDTVSGLSATFTLAASLLEKGANSAATTFTPNGGGIVAGPASAGVFTLAANPTVTADTTNGALNISYTPPVANTDLFYAHAKITYTGVRFN